jgi:hypothetical protein
MADSSAPKPDKYEARLTQAVDHLRGNVKWTLVAFGAIGTTLLAGSQLSNLGKFPPDDPRLWFALACAFVALLVAALAVRSASAVAYSGYVELDGLTDEDLAFVQRNPYLLEGFASVAHLKQSYKDCVSARHEGFFDGKSTLQDFQSRENWFRYLDTLIDKVLSYIRYNKIRQQVEKSRTELTGYSVVAAIALVGFAWAANPKIDPQVIVLKAVASEARLKLTDAGKKTLEPMLGAQCVASGMIDVIALDPAAAKPEAISVKTKDCPVVRFSVGDTIGSFQNATP